MKHIRISESTHRELKLMAVKQGISLTELIKKLVEKELQNGN